MSRFLHVFSSSPDSSPPFWFMRQAGRYLKEYRDVRESCEGGFLELCYTPEKACEVTLQPIRRFGMDAAIIFSDILVIPHAMGMDVRFVKGEGPRLEVLTCQEDVDVLSTEFESFLAPVYEALTLTRKALPAETALIGFAGAPWTLVCYMLEGKGGQFERARRRIYSDKIWVDMLYDKLVDAISRHLIAQVKAGAQALQLFDSWAGIAPAPLHDALIIEPTRRIVERVKKECPDIPFIGFPRGLGTAIQEYAVCTGVDGISIDTAMSLEAACNMIPESCVIQGNLDPLLLAEHGDEMMRQTERILSIMEGRRFIFNLGHGIVPDTPVDHVTRLCDRLKVSHMKQECA